MSRSVTIRRRVQWMDTDAAGIWHHSTAIRWAEDAEAELHRRVQIIDETFGATPRVHLELDFDAPLRFDDEVAITLEVVALGDSSITYRITIEHGSTIAVRGRMIAVLVDRSTGTRRSWPDHLREALT